MNIALINFDFRNLTRDHREDFLRKLDRDRLGTDKNNFFVLSWGKEKYELDVPPLRVTHRKIPGLRIFAYIATFFLLPREMKKRAFRPDAILAYDPAFVVSSLGAKLLYGSKLVWVVTNLPQASAGTRPGGTFKQMYVKCVEQLARVCLDAVYTINETTKKYCEGVGIPAYRIRIFASDVIIQDKESMSHSQPGAIRQRFGLSPEQKMILSVGRLESEKGFDRLLRAFASVDPSYVLVIVGEGKYRPSLEKLIVDLGLTKRVFLAGYVDRKNIWDYYQDAAVFVLLSRAEALGLVFWEAMSMGVPVIGSRTGGIVESIGGDGERGFFWDEEKNNLNELIQKCVKRDKFVHDMINRAREYVDQQTSNRTNIGDII